MLDVPENTLNFSLFTDDGKNAGVAARRVCSQELFDDSTGRSPPATSRARHDTLPRPDCGKTRPHCPRDNECVNRALVVGSLALTGCWTPQRAVFI